MSADYSHIADSCSYYYSHFAAGARLAAYRTVTFDRSQEFIALAPSDKARARSRQINLALFVCIVFASFMPFFIKLASLGHAGSALNSVFASVMGTISIVALKEAIIQHFRREKEMKESGITESEEHQYLLRDFLKEFTFTPTDKIFYSA